MKRVLLDTNIYGEIVRRGDRRWIKEFAETGLSGSLAVYGNSVIRKELRDISKKTVEARRTRLAVLTIYDLLVGQRSFELTSPMRELAENYGRLYKELKGQSLKRVAADEKLHIDFLIIASASVKGMDIVYSSDVKTMLSSDARKAYKIVNDIQKLRTPNFENYENFIREIKRWLP